MHFDAAAQVKAGRRKELDSISRFKVWDYVPERNATGGSTVRVKWVDILRGDEVRSRLVAMEFAYDLRADTHAGTPPLVIIRLLISKAASSGRARGDDAEQLAVYDVTCAFLHAELDRLLDE